MLNMDKKNIYVDAAASALKSESVIRAQEDFLRNNYANAGRGTCLRAGAVDKMVADARAEIARFIGAESEQIIFTSGTTDGLNRIANMLPRDSIVAVSDLDHHSARLPFETKYKTVIAPLDKNFDYDVTVISKYDAFVITAMSNVMGIPQKVKEIIARARELNPKAITIVDAAQYVTHFPIDVNAWDCDFLCFSGHKIGADTGIGVMYIKNLKRWQPDKFGGGMVTNVVPHMEWVPGPEKFEAGTLPLTQIAGLWSALIELGIRSIKTGIAKLKNMDNDGNVPAEKEGDCHTLLGYLRKEFSKIPRIKFISPPGACVLTFTIDGMHPLDFGTMMGARGVCLRVGNMCTAWLHRRLGIDGSIRISAGPWNTMEEMEKIVALTNEILER